MARVTIADLAERLGISEASVSYALNGRPGVSAETRERVTTLAAELGWYPSSSARALSRARTDDVGLVLLREPESIGSEAFYLRTIAGIESVLSRTDRGLLLRIVGGGDNGDLPIYARWAAQRRVDGVFLFDVRVDDERPALLSRLGLPFVVRGQVPPSALGLSLVSDDAADTALIAGHLSSRGHRLIGLITGPRNLVHEVSRLAEMRREARNRGMTLITEAADFSIAGGADAASRLLSAANVPTAIVASNDLMAVGAAMTARDRGPLSVVSWEDTILCGIVSPPISALARHPERQGERAAEALVSLLDGTERPSLSPEPSVLMVRE